MIEETDTAILELLASAPGYLSGQMIARKLKLSRTAVWKRVTKLRDVGCRIESARNRGYRLIFTPDNLLPPFIKAGLNTSLIAHQIYYYPEVDSTNSKAKTIATQGAPDGTLVLAEHQTRGQGRLSRTWVSPPGKNLLFSLIFYPAVPPNRTGTIKAMGSKVRPMPRRFFWYREKALRIRAPPKKAPIYFQMPINLCISHRHQH